ncbi:hypothetical protein [Dyella silvatica]|uniref:hypothetical protein n=1 Tax=Dyella silvatica TaxID=2992128 RepID=UPI00224F0EC6|nr:hypothetical protein [Dyella silvatica]
MLHRQEGERTRGLALLNSETRESLSRHRWRQPPLTRPALALTLTFVLLLHALFALVLWHEIQLKPSQPEVTHVNIDRALIVRLIDHPSKPLAAPPPEPPALPTPVPPPQVVPPRARPVTREKPSREAMVVQDHQAAPAPAPSVATPPATSLFSKNGSVRLPPTTQPAWATASPKAKPAKPADDRQIMQHDTDRMHTQTTRFDKYFPPPNETAGGAVSRHIGDAIKDIAKSVCDPKRPGFNPLCGAPPVPPSPKNHDERLNLPSRPLVEDLHPATPPPLSSCIAEYRAGQSLSDGCPLDTPDLAFKAEMRECIDLFRAGKRLKTWCPLDTPQRAAAESSMPAVSSSVGLH